MKKPSKALKISLISLLSLALFFELGYLWVSNYNVRTIISGEVYRSAQLSVPLLTHLVKEKHIRSVINLRGKNPKDAWYRNEKKATQKLGLNYYNVQLDAFYPPSAAKLQRLVHLLQTVPRPLLIHCKNGIDRSGLAAAIVLLLASDPSLSDIEKQFSWRYFVIYDDSVGKLVFGDYAGWLKKKGYQHSRAHFLTWVGQLQSNHLA